MGDFDHNFCVSGVLKTWQILAKATGTASASIGVVIASSIFT